VLFGKEYTLLIPGLEALARHCGSISAADEIYKKVDAFFALYPLKSFGPNLQEMSYGRLKTEWIKFIKKEG
jgi:hypothetical protein